MRKIVMLSVAAMALASCSQDEIINGVQENRIGIEEGQIAFRSRTARPARAMDLTSDNIESFMVYAFKGTPDDIAEGKITEMTDYFDSWVEFKKDDEFPSYFNSDQPYYYPTDNEFLFFPAYAPAKLNAGAVVSADKTGGMQVTGFKVAEAINEQLDLLLSCNAANRWSDSSTPISMDFFHMLTKVYVERAWNSDTRYKYEVAGVKLGNIYKSGDCKYKTADLYVTDEDGAQNPDTDNDPAIDVNSQNDPIKWSFDEQSTVGDITYIFDEAIEIGTSSTPIMDGTSEFGSFLMIPQQLKAEDTEGNVFIPEETSENVNTLVLKDGVSYIALLIRITEVSTGKIIYPYAKGVDNISEEVGGVKYAWAAFPVGSRWSTGCYTCYAIDFSKGAGFVAPGAEGYLDEWLGDGSMIELEYKPILGGKIQFTEATAETWYTGQDETVDHKYNGVVDEGDFEDPFGE